MSLQVDAIKDGWTLASIKKSQILKAAHAIRKQAAKIYKKANEELAKLNKCKVVILWSVCIDMARKGEKLKVVKVVKEDDQLDLFGGEKVRTIEIVKDELKALEAKYKADLKKSEQMDLLQSDWTSKYGFNREICQDKYLPKIKVLEDELFALVWTLEVTVARRQAWADDVARNRAEYQQLGFNASVALLEKRNGFKDCELKRAIAMHNLPKKGK